MIAAEKLIRYLARLSIRGTQLPDKPPSKKSSRSVKGAKRLRSKNSFGGKLSPTRCGLPAAQDIAPRTDIFTSLDVAASLTAIKHPTTRLIVEWLATTWLTPSKSSALMAALSATAARKFPKSRPASSTSRLEALAAAVLTELRDAEGCMKCNTNGTIYDPVEREWISCPSCDGTGIAPTGYRQRMARINTYLPEDTPKITDHQFRTHWAEPYQWLLDHCHQRIADAWHQIRSSL